MRLTALRWGLVLGAIVLLPALACKAPTDAAPTEPPATEAAGEVAATPTGVIRGVVWHEICEFEGGEAGEPVVLGRGCVQWGGAPEEFGPNQMRDDFESGFAGVTLHLGAGACPASGLAVAQTAEDGGYAFAGLAAGTYCVSYSNTTDGNDALLIPGGPTYPGRDEAGFFQTVDLGDGEEKQIDFGYAWQFFD